MCGIVGGISYSGDFFPSQSELSRAAEYLKYRGPDDKGDLFISSGGANVALAHRRLSIIDLSSTGRQPMKSVSGRSCIVFNGEIYNYKLLRKELENNNCTFKTHSDTEVILNSFECWGIESALQKLDGMFAFALFDLANNRLFLARDRFGKKPLYYFRREKQLVFSSDIRSFDAIESVPRSVDLHAVGYLFAELSTPSEHTVWRDIKKLKPGSYLQFDSSGLKAYKSYWNLAYTESCRLQRKELIGRTEDLLTNAVKKRLVADVHVSAMLSGGIDSSLVVAKMAELTPGRVKTYSVGFNESEFNELPYARQVADVFNTDHTEIVLQPESFQSINKLISEFGEPFADVSMIPTYWISKEISKNEKVVLGGDGGDEFFAGYSSYYFAYKFDIVKRYRHLYPIAKALGKLFPAYRTDFLTRLLCQANRPKHGLLNRNFSFDRNGLKRLFTDEIFFGSLENEHKYIWDSFSPESSHDLINVMAASLKTRLVNDYLVKIDRASMFASLEMRSPFLDKDLCEFAATLNPRQLLNHSVPKSILKDIAGKYFSTDFINRNKMGFAVPVGDWFKGELAGDMQDVLLGGKQKLLPLNYSYIEEIINDHCTGVSDNTHKLWALYVFHIWANSQ